MSYNLPTENSLRGPFQPMRFEATVDECIVTHGEIPEDLAGGFYRVGPTWKRPTKQGTNPLLSMDGMVQALVFEAFREGGDFFVDVAVADVLEPKLLPAGVRLIAHLRPHRNPRDVAFQPGSAVSFI